MTRICVISGSPKGENSITYQTVLWIEKHFKGECSFETFHVGKSRKAVEAAAEGARSADIILFCYPVYTFMAPSQLHYALAALKPTGALDGKCFAQVTTSKHFYDTTAHGYIRENCADLGMHDLGVLSADMEDLLSERGQKEALDFWKLVLWRYGRVSTAEGLPNSYAAGPEGDVIARAEVSWQSPENQTSGKRIALIASLPEDDTELAAMIGQFKTQAPLPVDVINVDEYPFTSGCISCFNCAADGTCIFKDGFDKFLRERIQTADAMVYAFRIMDHSMGPRMKMYDDRQFCNGHRTVTMGMPVGYIVAGDMSRERNLDLVIRGRADVGANPLCGVADTGMAPGDSSASEAFARKLEELCATLRFALDNKIRQPQTFLGVGGMKIFRDLIYQMQGLMRADYKFFKSHGQFDFPQQRRGTVIKMYLVGWLMNNPKLKAKAGGKITEGMIGPYKKVLEK